MLQLVLDSLDLHDLKHGLYGNYTKLLLGILTLVFDGAFFLQHHFYHDEGSSSHDNLEEAPYNLLENGDDVEVADSSPEETITEFV
jgi:hypothetical protein